MAVVVDILDFIFCFGLIAVQDHRYVPYPIGGDCRPIAAMLFLFALIFCFLPPYSRFKLHVCWPLTATTLIPMLMLA
jgi:hypothetical protein